MQTYKEYRPTAFDGRGLALPEQQSWLVVPVIQTRDSEALELSNFASALKQLGGESATVEVHRFGHWGPGWFEIIIVSPDDIQRVAIAEEIESTLEDYPVLNESDLSERENDEYQEAWEHWMPADFASVLKKALGLADTTEWYLGDCDALQALYEELTPSGDYWESNHMSSRLESAAARCTRERMAQFLRENREREG